MAPHLPIGLFMFYSFSLQLCLPAPETQVFAVCFLLFPDCNVQKCKSPPRSKYLYGNFCVNAIFSNLHFMIFSKKPLWFPYDVLRLHFLPPQTVCPFPIVSIALLFRGDKNCLSQKQCPQKKIFMFPIEEDSWNSLCVSESIYRLKAIISNVSNFRAFIMQNHLPCLLSVSL